MKTRDLSPFHTQINPPPSNPLRCVGPGAEHTTQQQYREDTDVNVIIRKAIKTGEPLPFKPGGTYGDFSILKDYQSALAMITDAQEAFEGLPAKVRNRFDNDPGKLVAFLADEKNYQEGIDLGFFEGPKAPPEGEVKVETLKTNEAPATPRA